MTTASKTEQQRNVLRFECKTARVFQLNTISKMTTEKKGKCNDSPLVKNLVG